MSKPVVAIVGRPNVGKSTLFNRIAGGRVAIVEDKPGVTRDRIYKDATWLDREFTLIDTGGIEFANVENSIPAQMRAQAEVAMRDADLVLFVVDAREGLHPADEEVAKILRRTQKPVIVVANKVENYENPPYIYDFYALGFDEPIMVSASGGMNTGDLLDEVIAKLPNQMGEEYPEDVIKIAVIGRPNVGKSSLVNTILGQQRVIVSEVAGTTRDAIDTPFNRETQTYVLIDTAGMRRRSNVDEPMEYYSVMRSLRAVERCDVVLMVIDAVEGCTEQDKKIAGYAHDHGKATILVINKWDLVEKHDKTMNAYIDTLREELGFMQYAPTIFVSALTQQRVHKVLELVNYVAEQNAMRIPTSTLNTLIQDVVHMNPPPTDKGRRLKIMYTTQAGVKPPTFILFVNDPELMHFSYLRYLENNLRKTFGFEGTPLRLIVRSKKEED